MTNHKKKSTSDIAMQFAGWVPLRRALAEHLINHKLTVNEYVAYIQLLVKADHRTGGSDINAALLGHWMSWELTNKTYARILRSLHDKRYIWYRGDTTIAAQPYWIDKYEIRDEMSKVVSKIDLSQLYDKETICQDEVDRCVQGIAQADDQARDQADDQAIVHKYNKVTSGQDNKVTTEECHTGGSPDGGGDASPLFSQVDPTEFVYTSQLQPKGNGTLIHKTKSSRPEPSPDARRLNELICQYSHGRPSDAQAHSLTEAAQAYPLADYELGLRWAATDKWWSTMVKVDYIAKKYGKLMEDYHAANKGRFKAASVVPTGDGEYKGRSF